MSGKNEEIKRLIDRLQSGLVELFDELKELRRLLEMSEASEMTPAKERPSTDPLLSEMDESTRTSSSVVGILSGSTAMDDRARTEPRAAGPEGQRMLHPTPPGEDSSPENTKDVNATVSRLLDPIAHELRVGDLPAEVIAEYIQNAKDYLIPKERPNDKVSRDMDIVLKFLRARGNRGIRPDERDNMLKRMARWKAHLSLQ